MEKYVKVSDMNKERPKCYTAEEIADSTRGKGLWIWDGNMYICDHCGAANKGGKRFCTYCGAKQVEV